MAEPFFTIYVPFHSEGYADAAKRALGSLEEQFFQSFETVIVVNGTHIPFWCNPSSFLSDTRAVFGRRIVAGRFHTLAASANAALAVARGQWFMRLDADDAMKPDALAEYVRTVMRGEKQWPHGIFVVAGHWDDTGELYGSGLAIRTTWLRGKNGYDENRPLGDGRYIMDELTRGLIGNAGPNILRTSYPVYAYNRHLSSMTSPPRDDDDQ